MEEPPPGLSLSPATAGSEPSAATPNLTVVGAAWRKIGRAPVLVVLGRGARGHEQQEEPSTAALTVYQQGHGYRFVGTAVVPRPAALASRRTYRFEFRLPPRVRSWTLERLVLRWQGADFEVPLPRSEGGGTAGRQRTRGPLMERYREPIPAAEAQLNKLRQEVAQVRGEVRRARIQRDEAHRERNRARREREQALTSLASVAGELEHVEGKLARRRGEFDQVIRELAARGGELGQSLARQPSREAPAPSTTPMAGEPQAVPSHESVPDASTAEAAPRRTASPAQDQVAAALSEVRRQLKRIQPPAELTQPDGRHSAEAESAPTASRTHPHREGHGQSWFSVALHRLAQLDPKAAGQVLVSLLPAQWIATPRALRYDLIVREVGSFAVDVEGQTARVEARAAPRQRGESDALITAELVQLGDLVARGGRRLLGRLRRSKIGVEGERSRLDDLIALAQAPLRLRDLDAVGAELEVPLVLRMVAGSIDPRWTLGQRFSVRFELTDAAGAEWHLRVDNGSLVDVGTESLEDGPATSVRGSASAVIRLLAGEPPSGAEAQVSGDPEPLQLLQRWIQRLEEESPD